MKKRLTIWVLVLAFCLTAAVPALAGNAFVFTEREITVYEDQTVQTELRRDGDYDGDGEIVYASTNEKIVTISEGGVITGVKKGEAQVSAALMRNGKRVVRTLATVTVRRAVTKVTLNTTRMSVYEPDDPAVAGLLKEPTDNQVLVIPAGTSVALAAICTPTDASNRRVTFTTSDAGVAKITETSMKAVQQGECDLTVASVQNPEVTETLHVLVIQPIKQIKISAGTKQVAAGSTLQLTAECLPDNATIPQVTWSSRMPAVATVDEYGVVTGLKRGNVAIVATAADGSRVEQTISLAVTQPVTEVTITEAEIPVIAGKTATARVKVMPADATDKTVTWSTSDPEIAKVSKGGQLTGVKAGVCQLIATSNSNPEVKAAATVVVSQLVTKIENVNDKAELSLRVGESVQTRWNVLPDDATETALTFKSNYPKIATVDEYGVVHALKRGVATITATAKDSGRRQGSVKITVIQPVTGVTIQKPLYYVQYGSFRNIRAIVQPENANNQNVRWSSDNEYVATVSSNGASTGKVNGIAGGTTTVSFTLEKPNRYIAANLVFPIVKSGTADKADSVPVGSGKFVYKSHDAGGVLKKSDQYSEKYRADQIFLLNIPDEDTLFDSLNIDTVNAAVDDLSRGAQTYRIPEETEMPLNNLVYIGIRENGNLAEASVRQAMNAILERKTLIGSCLSGYADSSELPLNPEWYALEEVKTESMDRTKAKELLAEMLKDQTLKIVTLEENPFREQIASELARELSSAGVSCQVEALAPAVYKSAVNSGLYDLYVGEYRLPNDMDITGVLNDKQLQSSWEAVQRGSSTCEAFIKGFYKQMPFLTIGFRTGLLAYSTRVKSDVLPLPGNPYANVMDWKFG